MRRKREIRAQRGRFADEVESWTSWREAHIDKSTCARYMGFYEGWKKKVDALDLNLAELDLPGDASLLAELTEEGDLFHLRESRKLTIDGKSLEIDSSAIFRVVEVGTHMFTARIETGLYRGKRIDMRADSLNRLPLTAEEAKTIDATFRDVDDWEENPFVDEDTTNPPPTSDAGSAAEQSMAIQGRQPPELLIVDHRPRVSSALANHRNSVCKIGRYEPTTSEPSNVNHNEQFELILKLLEDFLVLLAQSPNLTLSELLDLELRLKKLTCAIMTKTIAILTKTNEEIERTMQSNRDRTRSSPEGAIASPSSLPKRSRRGGTSGSSTT
jgi:hypothetical protein